jgi:putative transposase
MAGPVGQGPYKADTQCFIKNFVYFIEKCAIPKLFHKDKENGGMKLSRAKLVETLRALNDGQSVYQARKIAGISVRRVYQVWNAYLRTGRIPEIGKAVGRPRKPLHRSEVQLVVSQYRKHRLCAVMLEKLIRFNEHVSISHNRIHQILLLTKQAKLLSKVVVRKKKWIRYERRHSLTAVHIDWYFNTHTQKWVFAVLDDASRFLLALLEVDSATTEESIRGMRLALRYGKIRQCISDHGCQFTSNNGGISDFAGFLKSEGIKQILCRIKHPQSNGKVEKFFDLYKRHRYAFESVTAFIHWYNELRPHMSLNMDICETPVMAFKRKKREVA